MTGHDDSTINIVMAIIIIICLKCTVLRCSDRATAMLSDQQHRRWIEVRRLLLLLLGDSDSFSGHRVRRD